MHSADPTRAVSYWLASGNPPPAPALSGAATADVAIVGARSPEHIRQTAPGADLRLSPEDTAQIELMLRAEVAVGGPAPEAMPRS